MSDTVWIAHPGTGGRAEVPAEAVPMYRQSGWDLLDDAEVEAQDKAAADEIAAAEKAMRESAAVALGQVAPPPTPPEIEPEPAPEPELGPEDIEDTKKETG